MNKIIPFNFQITLLLAATFFSAISCKENTPPEEAAQANVVEDTVQPPVEKEIEELKIIYNIDSLTTDEEVANFDSIYDDNEKKLISALNRVDVRRVNKGDVLVVPDTITNDFMDYSPFPETFEPFSSIPKTVLISRRIQAFALYENENLIKWGPVSSGKESTPTPAGLHYGNYKAKNKISTVNKSWLMPYYFNFMNFEGVGVHQYSMPGYPASHACVRLRKEDAIAIYDWAEQWELTPDGQTVVKNGTPFMVLGDYDFDKPVPWLALANDPKANDLSSEEKDILKKYVSQYMKDDRNFEKDEPQNPESEELAAPPNELETIQ